jgi:formylglycine-generating enzyme required for sulfatase activity
MQTSNNHSVSGQELDNLLKQAFLNLDVTNPKHDALMETVANTTLSQPVAPAGGTGKSFFSAKMIIFGLGLITLISLIVYFFIIHPEKKKKETPSQYSFDSAISSSTQEELKLTPSSETSANTESYNASLPEKAPQETPAAIAEKQSPLLSSPEKPLPVTNPLEVKTGPQDSSYIFPVLTDEEIADNEKRKEKMLIQSIKLSSAKYAFIPQAYISSAYFNSKGPLVWQYMQTTEVSNIEYKTFLFDLLIRNDRAGFLKAKPEQALWNTIYDQKLGKYFEDFYFSDKAFNDYPVVNISREGAELYCKWLKEESFMLADEKNMVKEDELNILYSRSYSLPTAKDWAYAAEGGKIGNAYPWDGQFMRNSKGIYLANFCIQKEKEKLRPSSASAYYTSAGVGLKAGQETLTQRVDAFKPNAFRLYNMSGNVAELVLDDSTKQLLAKGGSWNSSLEELKINSNQSVKGNGASPDHGFRPVINIRHFMTAFSYRDIDSVAYNSAYKPVPLSPIKVSPIEVSPIKVSLIGTSIKFRDSVFYFPKISGKEILEGLAMKEKMIKDLLALRKEKYAFIPMGSCSYQSNMVSTYAFYMQTTEVSNAEYKAFLVDLYMKGKYDEFRKYLPDQKQWTEKFRDDFADPMKHLYFGHQAYDNYPVVNISRYAAEAYCQWLSTELGKRAPAADKHKINDIRLPSDMEWAMAASGKHNQVKYATGSDSLMYKGKYLSNYSCVSYSAARYDSLGDFYRVKVEKGGPGFMSDEVFFTGPVTSYASNLYGIYNLAGNVSEMVYLWDAATNKAKGFGTKGGSWVSPDYFLEIDARQEFNYPEKPSPFVGFRPVMTALIESKDKK